jgi:hypothetical protein
VSVNTRVHRRSSPGPFSHSCRETAGPRWTSQ